MKFLLNFLIILFISPYLLMAQTNKNQISNQIGSKTNLNIIPSMINVNQIPIDEFENPSPKEVYQVNLGDESSLSLDTSSDREQGNFSLALSYYLKTSLPAGTFVALERYFTQKDYLDLSGTENFSLFIKGDGSDNILRITFIDSNNELWEYENPSILHSIAWKELSFNISDLKLSANSPKKHQILDFSKVKGYKITIYNHFAKTVSLGEAIKISQGTILLDNFITRSKYMTTAPENIPTVKEPSLIGIEKENPVKLSGYIYSEYFNAPTGFDPATFGPQNLLRHWADVNFDANYGIVSGRVSIAGEAQSFGNSAYRLDENNPHTGQVIQNYPEAIIPYIQVRVNKIADFISIITVGNIDFAYTRYTFSPVIGYDNTFGLEKVVPGSTGFKGASAEGNIGILNYHTFFIEGPFNSYTYGGRLNIQFENVKQINMDFLDLKFYYVAAQSTANDTNAIMIKNSGDDTVWSLDIASRFFKSKIGLEGFYAEDNYNKQANIIYVSTIENPYLPIYLNALNNSISEKDKAYKAKIIFDSFFLNKLYVSYEFRHMGENFKPEYRAEPIIFDDIDSDQIGNDILATYPLYGGILLTGQFDELKRISWSGYYRNQGNAGISFNLLRNLFLSYNIAKKQENYQFVSDRSFFSTAVNAAPNSPTTYDQVLTQEFYIKAQIRYNLDLLFKIHIENVTWLPSEQKFVTQSLYIRSNYYMINNFTVFLDTRVTRMGLRGWYSPGYDPYTDNFFRVGANFSF